MYNVPLVGWWGGASGVGSARGTFGSLRPLSIMGKVPLARRGNRSRLPSLQPRVDTSRPFRTRDAALAGAPTRGTLAGPGFRSPFRGTHVAAGADDDLVTRAHAAALLVEGG